MRVTPVDERDCGWEDHGAVFRVYVFSGAGPSYSAETFDISDSDVSEVIAWARTEAGPDRRWSIALVRDLMPDGTPERGLVWLIGRDFNDAPDDEDQGRRLHF
ncbi:hypothetical protein [Rhabdothermincola salaria]|uniref:hypothetical protein n=1 Tax=Rhabdothermincola salaria TaxID=2903142 RepID=UPI001E591716|nr:hypothetical protein [Rhabdothermincola salaria]MCD9625005.1 hypothetical protein [Rhabdothermincola salaria]